MFGYSPKRANQIKDELDAEMAKIDASAQRLMRIVPDVGAITTRSETLREDFRELTSDLQAVVDRRTDVEATG